MSGEGKQVAPTAQRIKDFWRLRLPEAEPWDYPKIGGQPDIRTDAKVTLSVDPARAHYFGAGGQSLAKA